LKRVAIEKSSQYSNYCFKCLGKWV
jgi:hypothetical protein